RHASNADCSKARPVSRASRNCSRSGGRGRLPTWVVRMRSTLRFIVVPPLPLEIERKSLHEHPLRARLQARLIVNGLGLREPDATREDWRHEDEKTIVPDDDHGWRRGAPCGHSDATQRAAES